MDEMMGEDEFSKLPKCTQDDIVHVVRNAEPKEKAILLSMFHIPSFDVRIAHDDSFLFRRDSGTMYLSSGVPISISEYFRYIPSKRCWDPEIGHPAPWIGAKVASLLSNLMELSLDLRGQNMHEKALIADRIDDILERSWKLQ